MTGDVNSFVPIFQSLTNDINKWEELSQLSPGENLEVKSNSRFKRVKSKPVNVLMKKLYKKSLAEKEAKKLDFIYSNVNNTKKLVTEVRHKLSDNNINPKILSMGLEQLGILKTRIIETANSNYYITMEKNYAGKRGKNGKPILGKDGKPVEEFLKKEQSGICDDLTGEIETVILDLGTKLEELKLKEKIGQALHQKGFIDKEINEHETKTIVSEAFEILEEQVPLSESEIATEKNEEPPPILTLASLEDTTVNEKWELILKTSPYPQVKETPEDVARNSLKGINVDVRMVEVSNAKDEKVFMPRQISVDLPRYTQLKINGKLVYTNNKTYQYDPVTAYKELVNACKITGNPLIDSRVAERIGRMMGQNMMSSLLWKVKALSEAEAEGVVSSPENQSIIWYINVTDEEVSITMKVAFSLRDIDNPLEPFGAILAKRVLHVPLYEIQKKGIEKLDIPMPSLTTQDKISRIISSPEYADTLLDIF